MLTRTTGSAVVGHDAAPARVGKTSAAPAAKASAVEHFDVPDGLEGSFHDAPETFLPVAKAALFDRLTEPSRWPGHDASKVRRFFRYLDYWRQQQYSMNLLGLLEAYDAFSPDTDLLQTRDFSDSERVALQARVFDGIDRILLAANYRKLSSADLDKMLSSASIYGLDFHVDLDAFDQAQIYYRGVADDSHEQRSLKKLGRKQQIKYKLFRRLCVVFKLKPFDDRVRDVMAEKGWNEARAKRFVRRARARLPKEISDGNIYLKLFRNIPHSELEMVFPNTQVKFRMWDKLRLGATASGGLGFGLFTSAGKIALLATNPFAAAGAIVGVGAIAFRQSMAFVNQKQRYMVVMAQKLYFHAMADNRGVIVKLAGRAAEEDIKEEWLLYSVLAKASANAEEIADIDGAIERYVAAEFGVTVDFDVSDALRRLIADGLVLQDESGRFTTLDPIAAAAHVDAMWDQLLDRLPDPGQAEGKEVAARAQASAGVPAGGDKESDLSWLM